MKRIVYSLLLMEAMLLISCQKEEALLLNTDNTKDIAVPHLKTGGVPDYLVDLIATIENMVNDGSLNKGNGNALIKKIEAAISSLERGNKNSATGQLAAYVNSVTALVQEGKIDSIVGEELIKLPEAIYQSFDWKCGNRILDIRDGNVYNTVKIGEQCWMAENLKYLPSVSGSDVESYLNPYYYVYGYEGTDVLAAMATTNYKNYGVLYNWLAVENACPDDWDVPSDEQWKTLDTFLGMSIADANSSGLRYSGDVGKKLKSSSGWSSDGNGDNSSGFNALPGGYRYINTKGGKFYGIGSTADFWTSTPYGFSSTYNSWLARGYYLYSKSNGEGRGLSWYESGFSVRCLLN